jgi:lysophospholipase L1-like esterase
MTTRRFLTTLAAAALLLLAAGCTPDDPGQVELNLAPLTGAQALTTYVALGDGLTAGFMDGGLVASSAAAQNGQFVSYPAQVAGMLGYTGTTGARPFAQPLIHQPGVGITATGSVDLIAGVLYFDTTESEITLLGATPRAQVPGLLDNVRHPVPYDNLGVPGASTHDVGSATSSQTSQAAGNAYFDLILRNPTFGNTTMLQQAIGRGPTLVTLWIGEADILGGARGGNPEVGVNITPPALYGAMLGQMIDDLRAGVHDRFGYEPVVVVGNLRSLTAMPYFIPKALFDQIVGAPIPTAEDDVAYVLLPVLSAVQTPGFEPPIPSSGTLTTDEAAIVEDAVDAYNAAIAAVADARDVAVVDLAAVFDALTVPARTHFLFLLQQGATVAQAAATTAYSLDGIHPNSHGYTLVANAFIDGINAALGLTGDDAIAHAEAPVWDPTYASGP